MHLVLPDINQRHRPAQEGGGSDSEEDNEKLTELEAALRQHSPEFLGEAGAAKPTSMAENYQLLLSTEQVHNGSQLFMNFMDVFI